MYVVTGATGHTGSVIAKRLLAQGKKVRVVGRSAERLSSLVSLGAEPFVADISNKEAITSFGADKPDKTGPISGLHRMEKRLKRISGLNALYARAGYFMENTLPQVGVIQQTGASAGPLNSDLKVPMIATRDIGTFAADELLRATGVPRP